MAIDGYLKVAAAQLRRAASTLKDDTNYVRKSITSEQQDANKTLQQLERQIKTQQAELNTTQDANERLTKEREVHKLQQQIGDIQRQIAQATDARLTQIRNMEQEANELAGQAGNLERQPGSF